MFIDFLSDFVCFGFTRDVISKQPTRRTQSKAEGVFVYWCRVTFYFIDCRLFDDTFAAEVCHKCCTEWFIDCCFPCSKSQNYETVPILRTFESKDLQKMIPAVGCLYVISASTSLLEIFTEAFQIVVRLATSEWKILLKQISYESRESGSPTLAVFVCGSLVAILAFACPLQNMTFIIAGSQLTAGSLRAIYFLYAPFRPKSTMTKSQDLK